METERRMLMGKMIISMPTPNPQFIPFHVGVEKGFFKKEGANVELMFVEASTHFDDKKALQEGTIQFRIHFGFNTKMVCGCHKSPAHRLIAKPEIKTIKELKGKTIGVHVPDNKHGVTTDAAYVLMHHGLDPWKDVTFVAVGDERARVAAMESGVVDAVSSGPPFFRILMKKGFRFLGYIGDLLPNYMAHGLFTTERIINQRAEEVGAAVRGMIKAVEFVKDKKNKEEAIDFMMRKVMLSREVASESYDEYVDLWTWEIIPEALEDVVKYKCWVQGIKPVPIETLYDRRFLPKP